MINLEEAEKLANAGASNDGVTVSRAWLQQAVAELKEAREAKGGKPAK